jgi:hypothetical protein
VEVLAEVLKALQLAARVELGDREEHLLLGLEVLVEGRVGDAGGLADGRDRGGLEALLAEERERSFQDPQLALGVALAAIPRADFGAPAGAFGALCVEVDDGSGHGWSLLPSDIIGRHTKVKR